MKFQFEIIVAREMPMVAKLFEDQENYRLWQPSLISRYEDHFDENRSINYYEINGRMLEVHIYVEENNLPEVYRTRAEMQGLVQIVRHEFFSHGHNQTRWVIDTEFVADGFVLKLILWFFPNMFKNRTKSYMKEFKTFAETN